MDSCLWHAGMALPVLLFAKAATAWRAGFKFDLGTERKIVNLEKKKWKELSVGSVQQSN